MFAILFLIVMCSYSAHFIDQSTPTPHLGTATPTITAPIRLPSHRRNSSSVVDLTVDDDDDDVIDLTSLTVSGMQPLYILLINDN